MKKELSPSELKEIARQLSCPSGTQGLEMAQVMNDTNIGMTRASIQKLAVKAKHNILELGHGNCGHLELLFHQAQQLHYYGLEISETMQKEAKRINTALIKSEKAEFVLYDGKTIPFENDFFDRIMTVNTLYFWEKPATMFAELYRVLQPEGIFVLTFAQKEFMEKLPFTDYQFNLYNTADVQTLAANAGFSVMAVTDKTEEVKNKANQVVNRHFSIVEMKK